MPKVVYTCFDDLEKAHDWVPREKLWVVLSKYGVDGRLSPAVKSLFPAPDLDGGGPAAQMWWEAQHNFR